MRKSYANHRIVFTRGKTKQREFLSDQESAAKRLPHWEADGKVCGQKSENGAVSGDPFCGRRKVAQWSPERARTNFAAQRASNRAFFEDKTSKEPSRRPYKGKRRHQHPPTIIISNNQVLQTFRKKGMDGAKPHSSQYLLLRFRLFQWSPRTCLEEFRSTNGFKPGILQRRNVQEDQERDIKAKPLPKFGRRTHL